MLRYLRVLLFLIAYISLGTGCKKKDKDPCTGIYCGFLLLNPQLHFNIQDKQTGADWFFSPSPRYPFSAIHVTNPADTTTWRIYPDSTNRPPCLMTFFGNDGALTLYIQAGDAKPDTLQCTVTSFRVGCCGGGVKTTNARLNGQLLNNDRLDTSILIIKK